jgi:hypothetical protein
VQIERRIAPFWRGLNDHESDWTEHQLVAAARGLPIPAADEEPPEDPARHQSTEQVSNPNVQNLTVPITSRSQSAASDVSANLSPSHPAFALDSPISPLTASPPTTSSPFKAKSKTLASLSTSSKNPAHADIVPREIQLPKDPYVNGQALEAYLYKDASECPICFLYYPPYLNKTRCCDQPICSECFVQIKRPDPHPPEHEHADPANPTPPPPAEQTDPETLVSEPACCPYCQQPEFGVTFESPPFRRGLAYANGGLSNVTSAMSSSSSINSVGSPGLHPVHSNRRRTTSVSANDSTVITTDRVRPDWATKLANARSQAARRSAAATALHTAAYLMGNGVGTEGRTFGFSRTSRFSRYRGDSDSGSATPGGEAGSSRISPYAALSERRAMLSEDRDNGPTSTRRRPRVEDIEEMMMMEAIRLSLVAEEEQKKKKEKEDKKEAKKKDKEDKKKEKAARKSIYGNSSASGSALSLSLPFTGRKRGNSASSNLKREPTIEEGKGKGVHRGDEGSSQSLSNALGNSAQDFGRPASSSSMKRHLDAGTVTLAETALPSPTATAPEKPSHLRQMSNVSSPASSFMESGEGSVRNENEAQTSSNASGTDLGRLVDETPPGESMFNFNSLVGNMIDENEENEKAGSIYLEQRDQIGSTAGPSTSSAGVGLDESVATLKADAPATATPEVTITPGTPLASPGDSGSKQLGESMFETREQTGVTQ